MVWRRERQHTAHVHRIHEARAVPSAAVRRPSTSLPEPNAAREAAQRARRSSQLQRHGRDSRHLKGRLPQNLVRIQTTRSEARQGQPGQEVRRREQCRAAARRERGPPFAALPITTHMPARHGHTPLQAPDFDLRRREGGRKERRRIDRRGATGRCARADSSRASQSTQRRGWCRRWLPTSRRTDRPHAADVAGRTDRRCTEAADRTDHASTERPAAASAKCQVQSAKC